MALGKVCDFVLWPQHVSGDPALKQELLALPAGGIIQLVVAGDRGHFEKMATGKDGRPTSGLKPLGKMRERWHALYKAHRGDLVPITRAE